MHKYLKINSKPIILVLILRILIFQYSPSKFLWRVTLMQLIPDNCYFSDTEDFGMSKKKKENEYAVERHGGGKNRINGSKGTW